MSKEKELTEMPSLVEMMFFGELDEDEAFPYPKLDDQQKEMAKEMVSAFSKFANDMIDSSKFDEEKKIPEEVFDMCKELGLMGLAVTEEHGGLELDTTLYARVFSEIASRDGSLATMLGAHQSIGYKALLNEGNKEQKDKWLPLLASGEKFAAFCLTEPGSGSDAYSIKTKAVDNKDGTYTINGQKLWITNGGKAEFYSVFCKTDHEEDGEVKEKISCFIVEKEREGISFGEKEIKMGIRASETRAVYFDKVVVPKENIIGELGKGFKIAMNVLNTGRLSLGSGSVGGMKTALKLATDHAKGRKQFDRPIAEFGLIQEKLCQMAARIYASESIVYLTTGRIDKGQKNYSLESAICKIYCSESLWQVVDMAMQIAGGNGYMKEYPYEQLMRDSRINLIFEGTNEILRIFLALSGLKGPGENLKELGKVKDVSSVLSDPIKSVGILSDFAKKRIGRMIQTKTFTNVHEELEDYAEEFASMLNDFAIKVENTLIKVGKKIIGQELIQGRIANMSISLYVILAVLSRTTSVLNDASIDQNKKDYILNLSKIIFQDCTHTFMINKKAMDRNLDKTTLKTSKQICDYEGYGLDIIDY